MIAADTITLRALPIQSECPNCGFLAWCQTANLTPSDYKKIRDLTIHGRTIKPDGHLYNSGAPLIWLYAIHSGFLKTTLADQDGREQVTGFCMGGDIAGLDAIGSGTHMCDASRWNRVVSAEFGMRTSSALCIPFRCFNCILFECWDRKLDAIMDSCCYLE